MCFNKFLNKLGYVKINELKSPITTTEVETQKIKPVNLRKIELPQTDITMKSVKFPSIPEGYYQAPMSLEQKRNLYNSLSAAAGVGNSFAATKRVLTGLYKAQVSPDKLIRYADGSVGSIMTEGGKFTGHSGFVQAGASAFNPVVVFAIMSAVTGQYYLKNIQKELKSLNKSIDSIIEKMEAKQIAKIDTGMRFLNILSGQNTFSPDDLILIRQQSAILLSSYYTSIEELKSIESSLRQKILIERGSDIKSIRETINEYKAKNINYTESIAEASYKLYYAYEALYLKALIFMGTKDPIYLPKISDKYDNTFLKEDNPEYISLYENINKEVTEHLKKKQSSTWHGEEAKTLIEDFKDESNKTLENLREEAAKVEQLKTAVKKPLTEEQEMLYDFSTHNEEVSVYIKK